MEDPNRDLLAPIVIFVFWRPYFERNVKVYRSPKTPQKDNILELQLSDASNLNRYIVVNICFIDR